MESKRRKPHSVNPLKLLIYIHGTGTTYVEKMNVHENTISRLYANSKSWVA